MLFTCINVYYILQDKKHYNIGHVNYLFYTNVTTENQTRRIFKRNNLLDS